MLTCQIGRPAVPLEERFWPKVDLTGGPDSCWEWTATRHRAGYGWIRIGSYLDGSRRNTFAHRVSWELAHGKHIPSGMMVRHRCDNPPCVNPRHLELGTNRQNMRDMPARGRAPGGRRKLTDVQRAEVRRRYLAGGISQSALGREFGLTQSGVSSIVHWHWDPADEPVAQ